MKYIFQADKSCSLLSHRPVLLHWTTQKNCLVVQCIFSRPVVRPVWLNLNFVKNLSYITTITSSAVFAFNRVKYNFNGVSIKKITSMFQKFIPLDETFDLLTVVQCRPVMPTGRPPFVTPLDGNLV